MVRTTRTSSQGAETAGVDRKPAVVTGYAIAGEYDEGSHRLSIQFPEFTEEERAFREALVKRTRARRDRQPPLGITSAELIREARAEAYGNDA